MTDDQRTGITLPQLFEQLPHGNLLRRCARVGFFTADVESALVADADGVRVVVQAVGTHHPLRTAWLDRSVTTDYVMVADAEFPAPLAMPGVDLSSRGALVGRYCRSMTH